MYVSSSRCSTRSDYLNSGASSSRLNTLPLVFLVSVFSLWSSICNVAIADEQTPPNPFENGWVLNSSASSLTFQTIKNGSELESSRFGNFEGSVDENGLASISIQLDSVDSKADLRNVRLRFLLFETYKFAVSTVTAKIDAAALSTLAEDRRITLPLEFELDLHGVKQSLKTKTIVTQLAGNQISVTSSAPVSIETRLFDLDAGVKKLEESARVSIVPMGAVSFNMVFDMSAELPKSDDALIADASLSSANASENNASDEPKAQKVLAKVTTEPKPIAPDSEPESTPYSSPYSSTEPATTAASEPVQLVEAGELSVEQCAQRFKLLSQTGGIYFKTASARLDPKSEGALTTIIAVLDRCPQVKLVVGGHTDSIGTRRDNQRLSELRAKSVAQYMINNQVDEQKLSAVGFGETQPLVPNNTRRNRERNRRIEFTIEQ